MAKVDIIDFTPSGSHNASYVISYAKLLQNAGHHVNIWVSLWAEPQVRALAANASFSPDRIFTEKKRFCAYTLFRIARKVEARLELWKKPARRIGREPKESGQIPTAPVAHWLLLKLLHFTGDMQDDSVKIMLSAEQMLCSLSICRKLLPKQWIAFLIGTSWLRQCSTDGVSFASSTCLSDRSCGLVLTLTAHEASDLENALPVHSKVTRVPEVVFDGVSTNPPEHLAGAVTRAGTRKIFLLCGILCPRKCVIEILRAWRNINCDSYLIMAGRVQWNQFTDSEQSELREILRSRENIFLYDGWIENESDLNWLICSADIVFAIYRDFQGSSNVLAKAATFKKGVIALANTETGRRVTTARIGLTTPSLAVSDIATSIQHGATLNIPPKQFCEYLAADGNFDILMKEIDVRQDLANGQ